MTGAPDRSSIRRACAALFTTAALAVTACGSDASDSLSPAAARGQNIARTKGCAGCHGQNGQGGVGPTWVGLPGSEVELYDGTVIVADDAYLVRAIAEPEADLLAEYALQMPRNDLTDAEIADVIAYIKELAPAGT